VSEAARLLLETAQRGELHHAILCYGPSAQALRDVSVGIAKTLNCVNGTQGDDCTACQRIERRIHPDVHFIEVAGERKMISVEQIREIVAAASLRPFEGRNKIFRRMPSASAVRTRSSRRSKSRPATRPSSCSRARPIFCYRRSARVAR
jgi:hypothetical protein